jgi:alpha-beta hydrolase superfamily lysophospholipase
LCHGTNPLKIQSSSKKSIQSINFCIFIFSEKKFGFFFRGLPGYAMECSVFMRATGIRFAQAGYAVYGIDQEGHGKSDGRRCYIESFQALVDDSIAFFKSVRGTPLNLCNTPNFVPISKAQHVSEPIIVSCLNVSSIVSLVVTEREENRNKARFLYGESMGGALALHIHKKEPGEWSGAVLQAPMCKVMLIPSISQC